MSCKNLKNTAAAMRQHNNRPKKENTHEQKYSIPTRQMQEVSPFVNGLILRTVCQSRLIFTAVKEMQEVMEIFFGVGDKEFWLSVHYLTTNEYLVQCIDGKSTIYKGDQLKIMPKGIQLLAGSLQDNNITV